MKQAIKPRKTKTIDERIARLEQSFMCPGTILSRALGESGFQWKLGIGAMEMPKRWFWGWTVDGVVKQAEKAMREAKKAK